MIGEHWGNPSALIADSANFPNVELHLTYMNDAEAAEYFARADFVVLPYRSATPSAVASLAFHYDKPIIASRVAGLLDVVMEGQTGILVPPRDSKTLASVIGKLDRSEARRLAAGVSQYKQTHGWDSLCSVLQHLTQMT